jgi:hypothetical protein
MLDACYLMLVAGCLMLDAGYWMLNTWLITNSDQKIM